VTNASAFINVILKIWQKLGVLCYSHVEYLFDSIVLTVIFML
jgi:hypothetical protein